MKKISFVAVIALTATIFLNSCSSPKADAKSAVEYYNAIYDISDGEIKAFNELMSNLKAVVESMQTTGGAADSALVENYTVSYSKFQSLLKSDLEKLNSIKEVDPEINLKANYLKYVVFVDSSMTSIMPEFISVIRNGTMNDEFKTKFEAFSKLTNEQQSQRQKIDELSQKFMAKYELHK